MPVYAYKGLNTAGKEVKGIADADSPKTLRALLKRQGIRITEHKEEHAKIAAGLFSAARTEINLKQYTERITVADIALTTRQLSTLLKSGITLVDALTAIVDQLDNAKFKRVFSAVKTAVNEGLSLADAMNAHPKVFGPLYISMVRAGEASGALDVVLLRLADFTEAQARLKSKVMSAMMYPIIMVAVGALVMLVLFIVVIPRITKIFAQIKAELPIQTKILIGFANLLKGYWFLLIPLAGFGIWYFFKWKKSKEGRPKWDKFVLIAPIFGTIIRLVAIARFSRTLATLLRSGVPVLTALDITKDVLNNVRLADVVSTARDAIREGESIAVPLKKSGEFPPIVIHMIAVGEKSGQLEQMLENVADNYDFQVDQKVDALTTLIEPIMIVGMGVAVAFVVFSILMPILQMSQQIR